MILVGLLPVVGCEQLVALRVLRFELGRRVEGVNGLGKISLPIVEPGNRGVDERLVRLDLFRLHQRLFRFIVAPAVFIDLGQREVVGRLVGFDLDHLLNDRLRFFRLIQFLRAVGGDEIDVGRAVLGRFVQDRLVRGRIAGGDDWQVAALHGIAESG